MGRRKSFIASIIWQGRMMAQVPGTLMVVDDDMHFDFAFLHSAGVWERFGMHMGLDTAWHASHDKVIEYV